jgi:chromosome segregation ATPase
MNKFSIIPLITGAALLVGACSTSGSSTMDSGQRIAQRGGEISDYGSSWSAGQKDVKQGHRLVESSSSKAAKAQKQLDRARSDMLKAENRLRSAQTDRSQGERMVQNGNTQMQRAEADYFEARRGPSALSGN